MEVTFIASIKKSFGETLIFPEREEKRCKLGDWNEMEVLSFKRDNEIREWQTV